MRQTRLEYHLENEAKLQSMYDQGMTPKQIAESMINERNINRINSYLNRGDLEGLEIMKQSNLKIYGNENGMTIPLDGGRCFISTPQTDWIYLYKESYYHWNISYKYFVKDSIEYIVY